MSLKAALVGRLSSLTTGASDDYFGQVSIVRADVGWKQTAHRQVMRTCSSVEIPGRRRTAEECIQAMQTGFPVSFFCKVSDSFVPRFLKTDDRLMFLLLVKPHCVDRPPQYWHVSKLGEIWIEEAAKNVCRHLNVHSPEMQFKSVVVLHCKNETFEIAPPLADTLIFLAAPHSCLGENIRSIKLSSHPDDILHDRRYAISHHIVQPSAKSISAEDRSSIALFGVRLIDPSALLRYNAHFLDFEFEIVRHRKDAPPSANTTDTLFYSVALPLQPLAASTEVDKVMKRLGVHFRQVDQARLELCFRDMATVRSWADGLAHYDVFGVGVHRYLSDEDALQAMVATECGDHATLLLDQIPVAGQAKHCHGGYGFESGAKSVSKALKNLIKLEYKFADLVIEGYNSGAVEAMPLRFTFCGQLLPPLEMEKATKEKATEEPVTQTTPCPSSAGTSPSRSSLRFPFFSDAGSARPAKGKEEDRDDGLLHCTARSSRLGGISGIPCFAPRRPPVRI
eukprot:TRINITY_DN7420_c0_g2_i1.p1 TRINITY_DN7420_c0_g2~~TRINITY_DN7420_c0_g2_i1.p1  ORF type:complete len:508 (-),score=61.02 TRINITY_DN7420_c0_g2_i1:21-1544(-)